MNNLTHAPSVQELLLVLIRQRKLILAVYVGVLLTAIVGIFVLPPQYRAASKVLVSSIRADISTSAERPTELHRSADIGLMELASQLEILRSSELVAQVLREMSVPEEIAQAEAQPSLVGRILGAPMALLRGAYRKLHNLDATEAESDPLAPIVACVLASEITNPGRVSAYGSHVIKSLTFFLSFILVYYLTATTIQRRGSVEILLKLVTVSGAAIGVLRRLRTSNALQRFRPPPRCAPLPLVRGRLAYLTARGQSSSVRPFTTAHRSGRRADSHPSSRRLLRANVWARVGGSPRC